MDTATALAQVDAALAKLRGAHWKERDAIKEELLSAARGVEPRSRVEEHLETAMKGLALELRWEVEEVLEALKPPPEPEPEPEEEPEPPPEDPNKPLTMADLDLVYDDPRGLQLLRTKRKPERWFATQVDPQTGRPQTFQLQAAEVSQLKMQLQGSPYWVLGAGSR